MSFDQIEPPMGTIDGTIDPALLHMNPPQPPTIDIPPRPHLTNTYPGRVLHNFSTYYATTFCPQEEAAGQALSTYADGFATVSCTRSWADPSTTPIIKPNYMVLSSHGRPIENLQLRRLADQISEAHRSGWRQRSEARTAPDAPDWIRNMFYLARSFMDCEPENSLTRRILHCALELFEASIFYRRRWRALQGDEERQIHPMNYAQLDMVVWKALLEPLVETLSGFFLQWCAMPTSEIKFAMTMASWLVQYHIDFGIENLRNQEANFDQAVKLNNLLRFRQALALNSTKHGGSRCPPLDVCLGIVSSVFRKARDDDQKSLPEAVEEAREYVRREADSQDIQIV
ncbi:hypothetical protein F5Y03DRAFT_403988 [Xylaria venustula]|nr:hypothetical protein F5Y03DRAFT_403988 [Xylaria venustula]